MKDDRIYLGHVLECIDRIEQYTKEGHTPFLKSPLTQDGVLRNLQTLGQSVTKLSDRMTADHPEVDWKGIVGLRNVLVHDYLGVNLERVWEVVQNDLPGLKQPIQAILKKIA